MNKVQYMERHENSTVKSLDRGLDILECVAASENPPSFSTLLTKLGIPRSSLFHLLNNLQARAFLTRAPQSDGYRLGPQIMALAKTAPRPSLGERVTPLLEQLSREINETCGFYVPVDNAVEVIASAISTQALSYTMKKGARAPLYAVSAGKIALAEIEPAKLKDYLARVEFVQHTPRTIHSKTRLLREIQDIKASGFAYSREEFSLGITAIATAVRAGGKFVGAINVALPTVRFTETRAKELQEGLRVTAIEIAEMLK